MLSFPTGPGTGNHYALGRPSNPLLAQLAYIYHLGHKKGKQNYLDYTVHTVTLVEQTKRETTQILSTVSLLTGVIKKGLQGRCLLFRDM